MLYSGWRTKKGLGFFGFSQTQTIVLGVFSFFALLLIPRNLSLLWFFGPMLIILVLSFLKFAGISGSTVLIRELGWLVAKRKSFLNYESEYVDGTLLEAGQRATLPGLLAPTKLLGKVDGGVEWGVVWDQSTDFLTTTFICNSQSPMLADEDSFNTWVGQWHQFLASLANQPEIEYVTITVETAKEGGATVTENLRNSIVSTAPKHAYDVVTSLTNLGNDGAAFVETRVSVTFNPARGTASKKSIDDKINDISRHLFSLQSRLMACGLSSVRRASPAELSANMKSAFNPSKRDKITDGMLKGARPLRWSQAGPAYAREERNHYLHDSGVSTSWVWTNGPRSPVPATVLTALISPGPYPKRVSLVYEPSDPGAISRQLEQERTALDAKRILLKQSATNETQRQKIDREFAAMAAREEALGAGFGDIGLYVTVTVPDELALDDAKTDIALRASQSKIELRNATCSQAAIFAVGLSAGLNPLNKSNKYFG